MKKFAFTALAASLALAACGGNSEEDTTATDTAADTTMTEPMPADTGAVTDPMATDTGMATDTTGTTTDGTTTTGGSTTGTTATPTTTATPQ